MNSKKKYIKFFMILFLVMFGFKTIVFADSYNVTCADWLNVKTDLQNLFNFMKILIPLLIIGLSSYDFIKSVTAKDDKDMKKAFSALIKRLVCAVIFFFLPMLIELLFYLFEINAEICIDNI